MKVFEAKCYIIIETPQTWRIFIDLSDELVTGSSEPSIKAPDLFRRRKSYLVLPSTSTLFQSHIFVKQPTPPCERRTSLGWNKRASDKTHPTFFKDHYREWLTAPQMNSKKLHQPLSWSNSTGPEFAFRSIPPARKKSH